MTAPRPTVVILAGPNGAGKSTAAPELLQGELAVSEFVNVDVIARGLTGCNPDRVAMVAGRLMLARLDGLATLRETFAFETTLASRSFAPWLRSLRGSGYAVHLFFLWLSSPELALQRVADRVRSGGHDVPADTIRRRYRGGLRNFFRLYQPVVSSWAVYNCSGPSSQLIAEGVEAQRDVNRILTENRRVVDQAIDRGIRKAMLRHKKDGLEVVIERDGKVESVRPEDLGF